MDAGIKLVSAAIISFSTSTLLFAIITENLFDKKIKKIYDSFQKIRNKEFDTIAGDRSLLKEINPLKGINTEIFDYAKLKQLEIDDSEYSHNNDYISYLPCCHYFHPDCIKNYVHKNI